MILVKLLYGKSSTIAFAVLIRFQDSWLPDSLHPYPNRCDPVEQYLELF